jgi:sulfatase maturation enzyme AslB (radical SAM superfamily)
MPETYVIVRGGGHFARLRRNLEFLSEQRAKVEITDFTLSFVVQTANFRETPDFVRLGKELGVDRVSFSEILRRDAQ